MQLVSKQFTSPNGITRTFYYREGTNDESTIIALFVEDYYKILSYDWKPGDLFIDLGSHIGAASVLASTIPGVKVIAVEALPENCTVARQTFKENNLDIKLYEYAIDSGEHDDMDIFYGDDTLAGICHKYIGTMNYAESKEFAKARNSVNVKTITLEQILKNEGNLRCKLLKTDVEGAEVGLLTNTPLEILDKIDYIRGEYHMGNYHDLLSKVSNFEDITPPDMNPIKESLTEFLWRNKNAW